MLAMSVQAVERKKLNFNGDWQLCVGDYPEASKPEFDVAAGNAAVCLQWR